jgi:hypothetical protein
LQISIPKVPANQPVPYAPWEGRGPASGKAILSVSHEYNTAKQKAVFPNPKRAIAEATIDALHFEAGGGRDRRRLEGCKDGW